MDGFLKQKGSWNPPYELCTIYLFKHSLLLLYFRKSSRIFYGNFVLPSNILLVSCPQAFQVPSFKLLWKYRLQTIFMRLKSLACSMMYCYKIIAKLQNVFALHFAFIMIIADISITIAAHVVSENIGFETVGNKSVVAGFFA